LPLAAEPVRLAFDDDPQPVLRAADGCPGYARRGGFHLDLRDGNRIAAKEIDQEALGLGAGRYLSGRLSIGRLERLVGRDGYRLAFPDHRRRYDRPVWVSDQPLFQPKGEPLAEGGKVVLNRQE